MDRRNFSEVVKRKCEIVDDARKVSLVRRWIEGICSEVGKRICQIVDDAFKDNRRQEISNALENCYFSVNIVNVEKTFSNIASICIETID